MAKSLSQANAAALNSLGADKSEFDTSLSVVESVCGDFIQRIQANIQAIPNFVNSGAIENLTIESAGDNEVHIKGSQHILYQNYGVNGSELKLYDTPYTYGSKMPPVDVFLAYIQSKNIRLVNNPKYYGKPSPFKEVSEDKQQEQLAWAMAKKVFQKGFKPQPIKWEEEKEQLKEDLKAKARGFFVQKLKTEIYNQYGSNVESKGK